MDEEFERGGHISTHFPFFTDISSSHSSFLPLLLFSYSCPSLIFFIFLFSSSSNLLFNSSSYSSFCFHSHVFFHSLFFLCFVLNLVASSFLPLLTFSPFLFFFTFISVCFPTAFLVSSHLFSRLSFLVLLLLLLLSSGSFFLLLSLLFPLWTLWKSTAVQLE